MRFAICNELFVDWPHERAFAAAREYGYTGVELAPFTLAPDIRQLTTAQREAIRRAADEADIEIVGLHWLLAKTTGFHITSHDRDLRKRTTDYLKELVRCCRELGGNVMVFGSPLQRNLTPDVSYAQGFAYATEVFQELAPVLEAERVTFCLEPLGPEEGNFLVTAAEADTLRKAIGCDWIKLILDCKAMSTEKASPHDLIQQFAAVTGHFHANDPNRQGPGMGKLPFEPIFDALVQTNYAGWVSVEVFDYTPGIEKICRDSLRFMQTQYNTAREYWAEGRQ